MERKLLGLNERKIDIEPTALADLKNQMRREFGDIRSYHQSSREKLSLVLMSAQTTTPFTAVGYRVNHHLSKSFQKWPIIPPTIDQSHSTQSFVISSVTPCSDPSHPTVLPTTSWDSPRLTSSTQTLPPSSHQDIRDISVIQPPQLH